MTDRPLVRYYRDVFSYLGEIQGYAYFSLLVFIGAAIAGVLQPDIAGSLVAMFREFVQTLRGEGALSLILAIFVKNASTTAMAIVFGLVLGLFPVVSALGNGLLLGALALQHPDRLWRVVPHGIFELPAVFIAWGTGIWLGLWLFHRHPIAVLKDRLRKSAQIFVAIVVPLLVVAAIIEGLAAAYFYR